MITLADVFRAYVKPSLKGRLILRKRTSNQTSERLKSRQEQIRNLKPAELALKKCHKDGKTTTQRVYVRDKGYYQKSVCPIQEMRKYLRAAIKGDIKPEDVANVKIVFEKK